MTAVCYNRFRIRTTNPESRRKILRWLFLTFTVYEYEDSGQEMSGRFIAPVPTFPRAAFQDMTCGLRGDQTLEIHILSYDIWTLYMEQNIYLEKRWYRLPT